MAPARPARRAAARWTNRRAAWLASLWLAAPACLAQQVTLSGSMGADKALLVIDGQPTMLVVGASARGVTLRRLGDGEADVEIGGRSERLRLGASPQRLGNPGDPVAGAEASEIVLPMGPGGHFMAHGTINGKPVDFMVDTGATTIALSQGEANRIGLDWKRGRPGISTTANGTVPVYKVNLSSVRIGEVAVSNVDAVVVPSDMPTVLLGNSFLNRFSMRRDSDTMRLEKKLQ